MAEHDWRTMLTTHDYVIVKPGDFNVYGESLVAFHAEWADRARGQVFSVGDQGQRLIEIAAEPANGYRGVCWRQTSVGDTWDYGEMTEPRRVAMMTARLHAAGLDAAAADRVVAALVEDWAPIDDYVEYNIDLDSRHTWLPS